GDESRMRWFVELGFGQSPRDAPVSDKSFVPWCAKFARYAATPTSYAAFDQMWYDTDVRDVLSAVQAPTMVLYKEGASGMGDHENAAYLAERVPGAQLVGVPGYAPVLWIEEPEALVEGVERFLMSVQDEEADFDRVLATVLFTDIVES